MHLKSYRVVRQIDHSTPQPAQKFAPQAFYHWLEKQRHLAERVVVCYEAGCFRRCPHRRPSQRGRYGSVIRWVSREDGRNLQVKRLVRTGTFAFFQTTLRGFSVWREGSCIGDRSNFQGLRKARNR